MNNSLRIKTAILFAHILGSAAAFFLLSDGIWPSLLASGPFG
ncbi:hypothetical protein [Janthinobacterium sp.]|nr:hypothetical protein [Janthinobacterium sp.]